MIKYFCDKCGNEITDEKFRVMISCNKLLGTTTIEHLMHRDCAVEFIGRENVEAEEKRRAESKARIEARKKARQQEQPKEDNTSI